MGNVEKGETLKGFMKTLADNNRLGILQGVCEKFAVLMGAAKGELEMVVQSASVSSHWGPAWKRDRSNSNARSYV